MYSVSEDVENREIYRGKAEIHVVQIIGNNEINTTVKNSLSLRHNVQAFFLVHSTLVNIGSFFSIV